VAIQGVFPAPNLNYKTSEMEELILNDEDIQIPYIPDLDDSDDSQESKFVENFVCEKLDLETLREKYKNSLSILESLYLHNHSERKVPFLNSYSYPSGENEAITNLVTGC
jgi:hypothetical protein